jgi:hypothetical protein
MQFSLPFIVIIIINIIIIITSWIWRIASFLFILGLYMSRLSDGRCSTHFVYRNFLIEEMS